MTGPLTPDDHLAGYQGDPVVTRTDTDGDGEPDRTSYDVDADGSADIVVQTNDEGRDAVVFADYDTRAGWVVSQDTDDDGRHDTLLYDLDRDGTFDRADQDRDGDGVADRFGYDMPSGPRGEPTRWVEGSPVLETPHGADVDPASAAPMLPPLVGTSAVDDHVAFGDGAVDTDADGPPSDVTFGDGGIDTTPPDPIYLAHDELPEPAPESALPLYEPVFAPVAAVSDVDDAFAAPDDDDVD